MQSITWHRLLHATPPLQLLLNAAAPYQLLLPPLWCAVAAAAPCPNLLCCCTASPALHCPALHNTAAAPVFTSQSSSVQVAAKLGITSCVALPGQFRRLILFGRLMLLS